MSRIGKMPIAVPAGVTVEVAENNMVTVKGPKGTLTRVFPAEMIFEQADGQIEVKRPDDQKRNRALHGLSRTFTSHLSTVLTETTRSSQDLREFQSLVFVYTQARMSFPEYWVVLVLLSFLQTRAL